MLCDLPTTNAAKAAALAAYDAWLLTDDGIPPVSESYINRARPA